MNNESNLQSVIDKVEECLKTKETQSDSILQKIKKTIDSSDLTDSQLEALLQKEFEVKDDKKADDKKTDDKKSDDSEDTEKLIKKKSLEELINDMSAESKSDLRRLMEENKRK